MSPQVGAVPAAFFWFWSALSQRGLAAAAMAFAEKGPTHPPLDLVSGFQGSAVSKEVVGFPELGVSSCSCMRSLGRRLPLQVALGGERGRPVCP